MDEAECGEGVIGLKMQKILEVKTFQLNLQVSSWKHVRKSDLLVLKCITGFAMCFSDCFTLSHRLLCEEIS